MSEYYKSVYSRRLNRYGLDYQSRIQGQRERDFDNYLYKTIYRVDFEFEGEYHPASLERYKQDYTETQCYLLTKIDVKIPSGTILTVESRDGKTAPWMVWWLEQIEASGYNRYVVLKMTHQIEISGKLVWSYFKGPGQSTISDTIKSATAKPIYKENNNLYMFITPFNEDLIKRELYFEVPTGNIRQGYTIEEFDISSTPGIVYLSVDPSPLREAVVAPEQKENDNSQDYFWLNGGASE